MDQEDLEDLWRGYLTRPKQVYQGLNWWHDDDDDDGDDVLMNGSHYAEMKFGFCLQNWMLQLTFQLFCIAWKWLSRPKRVINIKYCHCVVLVIVLCYRLSVVIVLCCYLCCSVIIVLFYVLIVCTVTLPPGVNPIAVDKYIYIYLYNC